MFLHFLHLLDLLAWKDSARSNFVFNTANVNCKTLTTCLIIYNQHSVVQDTVLPDQEHPLRNRSAAFRITSLFG